MPSVGSPDFQAVINWRGPVFSAGSITVTSAVPVVIDSYITNYASLLLTAQLTAGTGVVISTNFYTDSTKAVKIAGFGESLATLTPFCQVAIPALGNFVEIVITTANAGNQVLNFSAAPTSIVVPRKAYQMQNDGIWGNNFAVAAGVTTPPQIFPFIAEGPGRLFIECVNAGKAYTVIVEALDATGAVQEILFAARNVTVPQSAAFYAMPNTVQMTITNNDVANQNYNFSAQVLANG